MTIAHTSKLSSKRKKTIAIVTNSCWNTYNFRLELLKDLRQNGYQILVIAPVDEYVQYLNRMRVLQHIPLSHLRPHSKSVLNDLRLLVEFYQIYRKYKPDLILHFTIKPNIFGSLAASRLGIPSVATITGLGHSFLQAKWMTSLVGKLYQLAFRQVPHVLFHNPDDKQLFIEKRWITPEKGAVVNGSGVNTGVFRARQKPNTGKFIFLFIGRLLNDKGIREFLEASAYLRGVTERAVCWIIGELDANNPNTVKKQLLLDAIQERNVKYFGKVRDVRTFIEKADAIVLPSYREGMPRAILEAMGMSKPVITTNTPGCRQTINPDQPNGLLVPPRDADALSEAMLRLYQASSNELEIMGEASRAWVQQNFDMKKVNASYLHLVDQYLGTSSKPSTLENINFPVS